MLLMNFFEIIGTIAFAISGALVGIQKKLDLFGVMFLSITTAVGGGILRDLILGYTPPTAFRDYSYCLISTVSSMLTWLFYKRIIRLKNIIMISDAIGLGVFTALGADAAFTHNMGRLFIVVSMGLFTGIGGGIVRDVFAHDIPFVFKKEIYAVASILGALCLYFFHNRLPGILPLYICFIVTFLVRVLSIRYRINLPVLKTETPAGLGE